jgi:hypothetical protein
VDKTNKNDSKINSGATIFGAIEYNRNKINDGHARVILQNNMMENYTGDSNKDLHFALRSFEPYLAANQRTEKPVLYISLNPDPKDQLTDEQYREIAQEYMEKMGFGNQPFIVYKHEDIDRHHLHIISVRVDENGKKISDSYEKLRSMDACRELETKYGLHPALKKERDFGAQFIKKIDHERGDVKRQISNTVRSLLQMYKFQSLGEYNALLGLYNIDVKHIKGEKFGKEYNGIVYSAKNDKGEIVSNPFKSSLFGKSFGFEGLSKMMKNNTDIFKLKDKTSRSKEVLTAAMRTASTREEFEKALKTKQMDVVFRTNDTGRIYGVTFIDHENKVVLNGSRLGKEFSANVFHSWFNEGIQPPQQTQQPAPRQPQQQIPQNSNVLVHQLFHDRRNAPEPAKSNDTSTMEELFGIFDIQPHGEDYEENAFARRMRKKKRKPTIQ